MFELLRAGKLTEVQNKLIGADKFDKFLWTLGSLPHYDNIEFQQRDDCDNFVATDVDREQNIDVIYKRAKETSYAGGNRCNLLFIETCLAHIEQQSRPTKEDDIECAVLGLQAGHYQAMKKAVKSDYQNVLWTHFRSAAT
jgi:hypothetical protein